ncbi:MAG: hypothetical protein JO127_06040 [Caulobacteraceae bacterium]|nr:hypothetical protein [Caulobacteraceae bacterium]
MRGLTLAAAGAMALLALTACRKDTPRQAAPDPPAPSAGAPASPAPPADQIAAARQALSACQRAAAVPNAQAVGPCMYDHGWTDRMTLDCSYGNKPDEPACYLPRGR